MAQLFDIEKVTIGPRALVARVTLAPGAPFMTSDDAEGTARVLELMPGLADHACLGDVSSTFGEVIGDTELAHLLEHVTVELLAQTDVAGDIASGRTVPVGDRAYEVTLGCPDDVLVAGALSSAVWILQWAYSGGGDPQPDVAAIASGLVDLVRSVSGEEPVEAEETPEEAVETPEAAEELVEQPLEDVEPEPAPTLFTDADLEPDAEGTDLAPEEGHDQHDEPAGSGWDMDGVPRPHLVR